MEIIIKTATLNELENVQKLSIKLFEKEKKDYDSTLVPEWNFNKEGTKYYQERISKKDGCVFIAFANNEIVGFLSGGFTQAEDYRDLPRVAQLEKLFIVDEYRSHGIGKQLCDTFIDWCKNNNVGKVRVQAFAQNELAIQFYRHHNFKDYSLILERDL